MNLIVLIPRYPKPVKTCDLMCFIPDTDNISPNLGRNIPVETVKTVKIQNFKIHVNGLKILKSKKSCLLLLRRSKHDFLDL